MKYVQKGLAGLALAGVIMAQPIQAQAAARIPASTGDTEQLHGRGGNIFLILGIFAALLLIAEATDLIDVFGNDNPTSP